MSGLPNRQWEAYWVPPGCVEANSEWPHPAPPGTDTGRFRGSWGGGGGLRSQAVGLGQWSGAGVAYPPGRLVGAACPCSRLCLRRWARHTGVHEVPLLHALPQQFSPQNLGPSAAVRSVVRLPGDFVAAWRPCRLFVAAARLLDARALHSAGIICRQAGHVHCRWWFKLHQASLVGPAEPRRFLQHPLELPLLLAEAGTSHLCLGMSVRTPVLHVGLISGLLETPPPPHEPSTHTPHPQPDRRMARQSSSPQAPAARPAAARCRGRPPRYT